MPVSALMLEDHILIYGAQRVQSVRAELSMARSEHTLVQKTR